MIYIARGWSGSKVKYNCKICNKQSSHEIIQFQPKINIGFLAIMGKGAREFGKECEVCGTILLLSNTDKLKAKKLKYFDKRTKIKTNTNSLSPSNKSQKIKYPVLKNKDREKYIKHNKKEGYLSAGIGIIIGLIVLFITRYNGYSIIWGISVIIIFFILGMYAAFEDPERKYRDYYRAGKKI